MPLPGPHSFPRPYSQGEDASGTGTVAHTAGDPEQEPQPKGGSWREKESGRSACSAGGSAGSLLTLRPRRSRTLWVSPSLLHAARLQGQRPPLPRNHGVVRVTPGCAAEHHGVAFSPTPQSGRLLLREGKQLVPASAPGRGLGRAAPASGRPRPGSFPGLHRQEGGSSSLTCSTCSFHLLIRLQQKEGKCWGGTVRRPSDDPLPTS